MPLDGDTPSLFPDQAPADRRRSADLRKAAALFDLREEAASSDEDSARAQDLRTGDLFAWGARQQPVKLRGRTPDGVARGGVDRPIISGPGRRDAAARGATLARCLDEQHIGMGGTGRGRRVMRNRVLFALLVAGVAMYVILRLAVGR